MHKTRVRSTALGATFAGLFVITGLEDMLCLHWIISLNSDLFTNALVYQLVGKAWLSVEMLHGHFQL